MKRIHRFLTLSLTAALFLLAPLVGTITASAAEPKTFQLKYDADLGGWRSQCLPQWDASRETGDLNFVLYNAQNGDNVVIDSSGAPGLDITFTQALANITVMGSGSCIVIHSDQPLKDFYAIQGAIVALNIETENAYVYDNCVCNLNKNVKNLNLIAATQLAMNVAAPGSVESCTITDLYGNTTSIYNLPGGALRVENGVLKTDPQYYSTTPISAPAPEVSAPAPSSSSSGAPLSPPTGENTSVLVLLTGALFCLAAVLTLRRKRA